LAGTLYVVATPIGNLEDVTLRALRILREEVKLIACEDTRQTQKLLTHYGIRKPLISYHEHNEAARTAELVAILEGGESLAVVTDAGTPLVSDPGYRVVRAAVDAGIRVVPLPGASAALPALAASGLPTDSFRFLGFLPWKRAARRKLLESLIEESVTVVAYESPHRLLDTLKEMASIFPDRPIALAREMTKVHEEFLRGTVVQVRELLATRGTIKGEITLVIGRGRETPNADPVASVERLEAEGVPRMDAIKSVAKKLGLPKREVYQAVEALDNSHSGRNRDLEEKGQ
jgi:16S rRNA (cytidine1402-2'-O)-methyltransferase